MHHPVSKAVRRTKRKGFAPSGSSLTFALVGKAAWLGCSHLTPFIMQTLSHRSIKEQLRKIADVETYNISSEVASQALYYDDPRWFFRDLANYGCASGIVGSLIYDTDTHDFYERHYREIEFLRDEWEKNTGEAIYIRGDLKNFLAWFAFEETAYHMAMELGLEI